MKKNKSNIIMLAVFAVIIVAVMIFVIVMVNGRNKDEKPASGKKTTVQPSTNLDGTPIEVQPYTKESGEPYVNSEGDPVYYVVGEKDKDGNPILVVKNQVEADEDGNPVFNIQKTEKNPDADKDEDEDPIIIKPADVDSKGNQQTTVFVPKPTEKGNNNKPAEKTTVKGDSKTEATTKKGDNKPTEKDNNKPEVTTKKGENVKPTEKGNNNKPTEKGNNNSDKNTKMPESINLGGPWGTVTLDKKRGNNVYKGRIVEDKLTKLKTPKKYTKIGAKFERGIYIPEKIGDYKVIQVAYTRLYEYKDEIDNTYDWYTERGIFYPGNDKDPLVYIEDNSTFELDEKYAEPQRVFLIQLSK